MTEIRRRDVWLVDLNPPGKGLEIHEQRPALIVSANEINNCPADLVVIVPITTTYRGIPLHVRLKPPEGGLNKTSFAKCDQIRMISKIRLVKKFGSVSETTMSNVDNALRFLLCL